MTEKQWREYLDSLPRVEQMQQNQVSETEKKIIDCFEGCGPQWNNLKAAMLNDSKLKRRVEEVFYDENGNCKVTEKYI